MLRRRQAEDARETPVLDLDYLDRLAGHLGRDTVDELLADGLIELADRLERVETLVAAEDREGLMRLSHDLIGIAGHLGLSALSAAAARMNREGRRDPGKPLDEIAGPVIACGPPACAALRDHLAAACG